MASLYWIRAQLAILSWQQLHNFITFYFSPPISGQSASVCLPLCNTNIVLPITILISELESPNLHQICTLCSSWSKCKRSKPSITKLSENKNENKPKCWQTETSASRIVDEQSRRPTKQSRNQNINKLRHTEKTADLFVSKFLFHCALEYFLSHWKSDGVSY